MKLFRTRACSALAVAAALSLTATPVFARGGGWDHHHRDDGIDGGDVLAGLLILGGIVAIASAAERSDEEKRERERDERYEQHYEYPGGPPVGEPDDGGYSDGSSGYRGDAGSREWSNGSFDAAVDRCAEELEKGGRSVATVDTVGSLGSGYRVEGRMSDGASFTCSVDSDLQIRAATVGGKAY